MTTHALLVKGINPVQWKEPKSFIGWRGHGGSRKPFIGSRKDESMEAYQNALRAEVRDAFPEGIEMQPTDVDLEAHFYFWRQLEEYASPGTGRNTKLRRADRTNLVKATEDALQGILYKNDVQIVGGSSWVVEQTPTTEPMILVVVGPTNGAAGRLVPQEIAAHLMTKPSSDVNEDVWLEVS